MKKLKIGKFSNGKEEFEITSLANETAFLNTNTGVSFLNAKTGKQIEIKQKDLISLLNRELNDFIQD